MKPKGCWARRGRIEREEREGWCQGTKEVEEKKTRSVLVRPLPSLFLSLSLSLQPLPISRLNVPQLRGFSFFSRNSAHSATPATFTTLNRTPGMSPTAWPRRPNPEMRTSSCFRSVFWGYSRVFRGNGTVSTRDAKGERESRGEEEGERAVKKAGGRHEEEEEEVEMEKKTRSTTLHRTRSTPRGALPHARSLSQQASQRPGHKPKHSRSPR